MNIQESLDITESILEATKEDVKALGGVKKVSKLLWPAKDEVTAQGRLRACLAPEHAQDLSPEELELILVQASKVGSYHIVCYFARRARGQFTPVEPRSRVDQLLQRMESLERNLQRTFRDINQAVAELKEHDEQQHVRAVK